ncbi:twin-arginine translocation signal domain-containing protein [Halobacterium yunchengense]|uniref:twin-arginine translocation signal domain-containing protein n=1 Tax=Halobacterium yunchengense TaxID=3108497 RepID=UPI0030099574
MHRETRGVDRRSFLKAAVAIGGASALSACLDREDASVPAGVDDPSTLPERQHAWNDVLSRDDAGNVVPPRHHALLHLEYAGGDPDADREAVEAALRSLERAYEWSNEGLLFTLGYSPAYFERFDADLPEAVDLRDPKPLSAFEDPVLDTPDAILHLASDRASVVLEAEEAARGNRDAANGVDVEAALTDAFEVADRRTGFVGDGLPADHQDVGGVPDSEPVPDDAPMYMGFESGFEKSQASEDRVTIRSGPFADGTTQHVSHMNLNLQQWYEQDDRDSRVAQMFCPAHADSGAVEGTGENLGDDPGVDDCGDPVETADEHGVVGHAQKLAATREDDEPLLLRRDFDSTDGGSASLHFLALQRGIGDFEAVREAMNGDDVADQTPVGRRQNNGIRQYLAVTHRGNYLLPPRGRRALPVPGGRGA